MRRIGSIQHALYEELPQVVATQSAPVRIKAQRAEDDTILRRLLHEIPSYRRIVLANRLLAVDHSDTQAIDYIMSSDGRLQPTVR